ncbi:hypothetical protein XELAEV_18015466mg [Xenopus laevis]|uniref:Uncharacterized protein n=1 Tax=Xenopus laevis TaxID=8355 RepID=A0A974DIM4_XENLA|nr:hypothetical protein XELAEV_18015466mg [Xenopus laevis]
MGRRLISCFFPHCVFMNQLKGFSAKSHVVYGPLLSSCLQNKGEENQTIRLVTLTLNTDLSKQSRVDLQR